MSLVWGVVAMVVITLIWASSFVVTKDTLDTIPVALLAFLRFTLALGSLAWVKPQRSAFKSGLWLGLLASAGFISLMQGLTSTTASKAAFIFALSALVAPFVSAWFFKRAVPKLVYVALLVALVGLALMTLTGQSGINPGDVWSFVAALFFGVYIAYVGEVAGKTSVLALSQIQYLVMVVVTLLWALPQLPKIPSLSTNAWLVLLYLGVVCTALPTVLQVWAQRRVPAYLAGLLFMLEPVFVSLLAFVWLGERLGSLDWLGAGLVFAALLVCALPVKSKVNVVPDNKNTSF
jgi:drug/metabolite transporter (DMT)-like permease